MSLIKSIHDAPRRLARIGKAIVYACLVLCLASLGVQPAAATFTSTQPTDWEGNQGWCSHASARLHLGDFNRDGRDDMLCQDTDTGYKWVSNAKGNGQFTGTDWEGNQGWCSHTGAELHFGDFNRDGRDDMLCHDTDTGHKWIAYAKGNGHFTGTDWERNMGWCSHASAQLHIGDFNRDSRDDMLCHDTDTGHKWIAYAKGSGQFTGTDWERNMGWCSHASARLHLGDFNRDGRDDMLCQDTDTGYKWVSNAKGNGHFTGTDWEGNQGWCSHTGAELLLGDFNRDGRDDMLCHDTGTGYKWIAYAKGNGHFTGTDWERNMGWCSHASAQLHIGDFNRDSRDDLLCHDTDTGYKWISKSNL